MKKYLETIDEILALKDTDTKIYRELPKDFKKKESVNYHKFVNGILCWFEDEENAWSINTPLFHDCKYYIITGEDDGREWIKLADKDDIGKLCVFSVNANFDIENDIVAKLLDITEDNKYVYAPSGLYLDYCRPLTSKEIELFLDGNHKIVNVDEIY